MFPYVPDENVLGDEEEGKKKRFICIKYCMLACYLFTIKNIPAKQGNHTCMIWCSVDRTIGAMAVTIIFQVHANRLCTICSRIFQIFQVLSKIAWPVCNSFLWKSFTVALNQPHDISIFLLHSIGSWANCWRFIGCAPQIIR